MKVGDLVQCNFQPRVAGYNKQQQRLIPMKHSIKGELGIITHINERHYFVLFPKFGHTHTLAESTLEEI